jgi:hypothetical protein
MLGLGVQHESLEPFANDKNYFLYLQFIGLVGTTNG